MPNTTPELSTDHEISGQTPGHSPRVNSEGVQRSGDAQRSLSQAPDAVQRAIELVAPGLEQVEQHLQHLLRSTIAIIPRVGGHLAFAGGKRFRPLVTLLAAQATGELGPEPITIGAVGELLHTATLLHDDVIDSGDFRRGRPSARYQYGNGLAVLTGDYCFARALQAIATLGDMSAVQSLATAVTRMAEGEVAQLQVAGDSAMDLRRYYMVIERKTAALIAWCTSLAGRPTAYAETLERYGRELGYAFQISDDIIDYTQDVDHSGKAIGQDLRDGKITLPLLLACERRNDLRARLRALLRHGAPLPERGVLEILDTVRASGALNDARDIARTHARVASEALEALPSSPARSALSDIAFEVALRTT